ncbi:MAG: LAGLIDADG family homing endonuclease [Candidatus Omnitrophota bacterium]
MLDPWYVTGFCDGEAAFTFSRTVANNVTVNVTAVFSVRQRRDNEQIVKNLQIFFGGVGTIYIGKETLPTKNSGHTQESSYYKVSRVDELKKILEHFDKYPLQSKKREVYAVWKDLVDYKDKYYGGVDILQVNDFIKRISALNQKSRAFKIHSK